MTFLAVLHIIGAVLLIGLVLIQDSKGAMGGSFGGGGGSSSSILGPTGATSFLFKLTRYVVIGFALTSLLLTKYTAEQSSSALDDMPLGTTSAPAVPGTESPAPAAPAETQQAPTEAPAAN